MRVRIVRVAAALVIVAAVSLPVAPHAVAGPRDPDDIGARIIHIIQKIQGFFGIRPLEDVPLPPRP